MSPLQTSAVKWSFLAGCCLLLAFLQRLLLGGLSLFGALPFLPPVILAVIASFEEMRPAVIFGMLYGLACDLALPGLFPCVYTVSFTLAALLDASLARGILQPGFPRALLMTGLTFLVVDAFCAMALLVRGTAAPGALVSLLVRETLASCPLLLVVYPVLRAVRRIFPD